jgi:large repetitive protein
VGNVLTDAAGVHLTSDQSGFVGQDLVDNSDETTVTLTPSANPVAFGSMLVLTCTVAGGVTPTGTVTFQIDGINVTTQALASGSATYSTATLPLGTHLIAAFYSGDSNNPPNSGVINPQTVQTGGTAFRGMGQRSRDRMR